MIYTYTFTYSIIYDKYISYINKSSPVAVKLNPAGQLTYHLIP